MSQLIEALNIFLKYGDPTYPTHCEHDVLTICGIKPGDVSDEDKTKLDELGFFVGKEFPDSFISFRFGSA
jgi:hypothetical protein